MLAKSTRIVKPAPQQPINHEEIDKTEARLLKGPTAEAWKKVGVKHHYGICVPLFGLRSQQSSGIGEFLDLLPLADFCNRVNMDVIQMLPLNDINTDCSPFSPISCFALNPLFLTLEKLPQADQATPSMKTLISNLKKLNDSPRVDWVKVRENKEQWLKEYMQLPVIQSTVINSEEYKAFAAANTYWLPSYCLFYTLKKKNNMAGWVDWPETKALDQAAKEGKKASIQDTPLYQTLLKDNAASMGFYQFAQYFCDIQLTQAKKYAESKGVWLKGDVPFLCSGDSADVWIHRDLFQQGMTAGAPPDMYSKDGQDWGLPLYNWPAMELDNFTWWKKRLQVAEKYYTLFRIDHIVGFYRVWGVPKGKKASEGSHQPQDKSLWITQGERILRIMLESTKMLPIGEDLGSIPKEVYLNLQKLGICGTRVLRWERMWDNKEQGQPFIPVEDYIPDSMSTVSTHDSETLPLWWLLLQDEAKAYCSFRRWNYRVQELKGQPPADYNANKQNQKTAGKTIPVPYLQDILRSANTSASLFHIHLLSEYLALVPPSNDEAGLIHWDPNLERVNIPGTVQSSNWSYRMRPTIEAILHHDGLRDLVLKSREKVTADITPVPERKTQVYERQYSSLLPKKLRVLPGRSYPLGATWDGAGVNFAVFSENGYKAYLCLFDNPESKTESHRIEMPEYDDFVHHCYLPDLRPGQLYGFRIEGDWDPMNGLRFNSNKVLLDPYAKSIGRDLQWDDSLFPYNIQSPNPLKHLERNDSDNSAFCPLAAVVDNSFTWGNDHPPNVPWHRTVIYEAHVKALTIQHPDVPEHIRGTYAGLCHESIISHLKKLGVTAIELEPIHHHVDEKPTLDKGLCNFWGYNTLSFFAPDLKYCATHSVLGAVQEFKTMVRVLHSHGIEVILDVVYNHTAEGNHYGAMFNLKGCDNLAYYKTPEGDPLYYFDYTGCGNSLNVRHPRVLQLIMDSLRYWIQEMHVDGFRFDLASALARQFHDVDKLSAFFDIIHQDPVISRVKLIAEPWDCGSGGYQVGNFPVLWTEWNGRYRDSIRGFWNGKGITLGEFATRVTGSSDLYTSDSGRSALSSINFITCHDGFNLLDLVSYNEKHNEANGENNNDGANDNHSYNHGAEGDSEDPGINEFRWRQRANFVATLFLSLGVPMILSGDELSKTQGGNNNTYCQDNAITWLDWDLYEDEEDFLQFTSKMIKFRKSHPVLNRRRHLKGEVNGVKDVIWYTPNAEEPSNDDWHDSRKQALAFVMDGEAIVDLSHTGQVHTGETILVMVNAAFNDVIFTVPKHRSGKHWQLDLSTDRALKAQCGVSIVTPGSTFTLKDHSICIFHLYTRNNALNQSRAALGRSLSISKVSE